MGERIAEIYNDESGNRAANDEIEGHGRTSEPFEQANGGSGRDKKAGSQSDVENVEHRTLRCFGSVLSINQGHQRAMCHQCHLHKHRINTHDPYCFRLRPAVGIGPGARSKQCFLLVHRQNPAGQADHRGRQ
jgi:hypothetical protein